MFAMMTIKELFRKYLDENMTPEEFLLFREMAAQQENRAELNRLFAQWIDREFPFIQQEEIDVEALYQGLLRKERIPSVQERQIVEREAPLHRIPLQEEQLLVEAKLRSPSPRKLIFLIATAAAAACLLIVAGLFLFRQPALTHPAKKLANNKKPFIIPASNKAILTLGDGTHIELDSAANGNLVSQGNTKVVKLAGGQLAYQPGERDPHGPAVYNEMTTPRGGYYQLILPDGSKVWLDAASSVRYPTAFTGKERSVELSGEAYFEIAPNARQPFLITSNGVTVQVLGTEFNLMAYQDEDAVRTTLVSGSVQVIRGNDRLQIRPGQQASWARNGNALKLSTPDMQEVLAWKQGEFRFQDLQIPAIMRQIARWYDVDVEFRGPQPENEFNGVIPRKRSVTDLLAVLEQTDVVHFTLQGRKIIVESVIH
jgi:transmembrane sensor